MKKIVVLTGSPRKNGNSNLMANSFIAEAEKNGCEIKRFDTAFLNVSGCRDCGGCFKKEKPCIFNDDFNAVAKEIMSADGIVIISPVYWYTFPAQIKSVIDKLYSLYCGGKDLSGKKSALISCCEDESAETFEGIKFAFEKSFELLKSDIVGEVLIPGVFEAGAIKNTDGEKQAAELFYKF